MVAEKAPTYFISDMHLEASRQGVTDAFVHFLNHTIKGARALYILGDFVDVWVGDDDNSNYVRQLKSLLAQRVSSGTHIYFIHGNRDFMIGRRFSEDTGVKILEDYSLVDLYGSKVLLLHGDVLCTDDQEYQAFRKKVRNPNWQKNMLRYPLGIRRLIARYFRYRSNKANSNKAENILDVNQDAVKEAFEKHPVKLMIHGHTHRPERHELEVQGKKCERIVLGDWGKFGWYLKAGIHGQELVKFPIITDEA